jgi:hypothetical protein
MEDVDVLMKFFIASNAGLYRELSFSCSSQLPVSDAREERVAK